MVKKKKAKTERRPKKKLEVRNGRYFLNGEPISLVNEKDDLVLLKELVPRPVPAPRPRPKYYVYNKERDKLKRVSKEQIVKRWERNAPGDDD